MILQDTAANDDRNTGIAFTYDDGGRAEAGFKGNTGDCVTRAISIATGKPYKEVYDALNELAKLERKGKRKKGVSNARTGVYKSTIKRYMQSIGWTWVSCMGIGTGCTVHLVASELPAGRLVVSLSRHSAAVIDGVLHDTYDSSQRGVTVFNADYIGNIPATAERLPDGRGWRYAPKRCVYGYWHNAT